MVDEGEDLVITGAELQAGIDNACAANAFGDEVKCEQMRAAAAGVSSHVVTLGDRVNTDMAKELVERLMDPSFCE